MSSDIRFEDAELYENFMTPWTKIIGSQFIDWISPAKGKSWVDIGCGSGGFTAQIVEECFPSKVDGIDPSDAQIDFAKKRAFTVPVNFQTGDAMELPYESNSFDIAVMALVIFFVPDPTVGVAEMKRVVKPGGTVAAYVWDIYEGGLPIEDFHSEFRSRDIYYALPPSPEASKYEVLESLWKQAGFCSIDIKKIYVERTFENFDEYWQVNGLSMAIKPIFEKLDNPRIEAEIKSSIQKKLASQTSDGKL